MASLIDICLVSPPRRARSFTVPAALLYLHTWLLKNGFRSRIVDVKHSSQGELSAQEIMRVTDRIVREICSLAPEFIGISCFTPEFSEVVELSSRIKKEHACKIVVGGVHTSISPQDFFYDGSPVDYVVVGDGQLPLLDILSQHRSGKTRAIGVGIAHDLASVRAASLTPANFRQWDEMPTPDYSQLDMEYYTRPNTSIVRSLVLSGVHIFTTFGCPFQCTFCANRNHSVTYRPISHVLDELSMLRDKYRIDAFYIQDDTFLIKQSRVREFVNGLRTRKLDLLWAMETRVNLFNEEIADLIARNGCLQVDFGVESGSADALKRMKKGITPQQVLKAFDICHRHKLRTYATFMFNTPGETQQDVEKTIEMIGRIKPTRTGIGLTIPYPGTEIYDAYVRPPVTKESYHLFGGDTATLTVPDRRFHMATHSLNLQVLREMTMARANGVKMLCDYTLQLAYWRKILGSKQKLQYVKEMTGGTLTRIKSKVWRHAGLAFRTKLGNG